MELIKNLKILRQKPNLSETLPIYHKFSDLQPYPILKPRILQPENIFLIPILRDLFSHLPYIKAP